MMQVGQAVAAVVKADKDATHRLASHRHRPAQLLAARVADLADQPPLVALSLGTLATGLMLRRPAVARAGARMLAAHALATGAKAVVKRGVDRSRPEHALPTGDERFGAGDSHAHELNSFPSGHTAGAVAVARAVAHEIDGAGLPASVLALGVAATQPASGHHYILDTLAGAAIGWAAEALAGAALERAVAAAIRAGLVPAEGGWQGIPSVNRPSDPETS